jgi:threonine dehydrogenase-like Zn-dependent dehydrogenase
MTIVRKEMNLLGSRNNTSLYAEAVELVQRYRDRCERLITQRFPLEALQEAMEFGEANPTVANKMVVQVHADGDAIAAPALQEAAG